MFYQIFIALTLYLSAVSAATELCIQGCCDLKADLSTSQLKLVPDSGSKAEPKVVDLGATPLKCCPCPDGTAAASHAPSQTSSHHPDHTNGPRMRPLCIPGTGCTLPVDCVCTLEGSKFRTMLKKNEWCPADNCDPKSCLCLGEFLQVVQAIFFGNSDKDYKKTVELWNYLGKLLDRVPPPNEKPAKDEL